MDSVGKLTPSSLPKLRNFHTPSGAIQALAGTVRLKCLRQLESVGVLDNNWETDTDILHTLRDTPIEEAAVRHCLIAISIRTPVESGAARIIRHCQYATSLWAGSLRSLRLLAQLESKMTDPCLIWASTERTSLPALELLHLDQRTAFLDDRCSQSTTLVSALAHKIPTLNRVCFGSDPFWRAPPLIRWEWRIDRYLDAQGEGVVDRTVVHDCKARVAAWYE